MQLETKCLVMLVKITLPQQMKRKYKKNLINIVLQRVCMT